jgi:hypothetical protein
VTSQNKDEKEVSRIRRLALIKAAQMGAEDIAEDIAQEVAVSFFFGKRKRFVLTTAVIDAIRLILGDARCKKWSARTAMKQIPIDECPLTVEPGPFVFDGFLFHVHPRDRKFFFLRYICSFTWDELIAAEAFTFDECIQATKRIKESIRRELGDD